jgi:DNA adenine methylase
MVKPNRVAPPLKWHGGKHYLAPKIVALMPAHSHYVEPFFGGGSVLLSKDPEGVSEVVNDLCFDLSVFWRVVACESQFPEFCRAVQCLPVSEVVWDDAAELHIPAGGISVPAVQTAAKFFVRCRQSLAGRMQQFAPLSRNRTRRGMNEQASAWMSAVDGLPEAHARLRRVVVLNRPALDVIRQQDGPGTLYYCDPPYLHETRATVGEYSHEMGEADHVELLELLASIGGRFLLSGYRSSLYDRFSDRHGWNRHDFDVANNAAGGAAKRRMTECVWCNF